MWISIINSLSDLAWTSKDWSLEDWVTDCLWWVSCFHSHSYLLQECIVLQLYGRYVPAKHKGMPERFSEKHKIGRHEIKFSTWPWFSRAPGKSNCFRNRVLLERTHKQITFLFGRNNTVCILSGDSRCQTGAIIYLKFLVIRHFYNLKDNHRLCCGFSSSCCFSGIFLIISGSWCKTTQV